MRFLFSRPLPLLLHSLRTQSRLKSYSTLKMTQTDNPAGITLPNSEQFTLHNSRGDEYLIQISWPLHFNKYDPDTERTKLPIIYIVDGNAFFLTATEALWRRSAESHYAGGGIVVAIGYPLAGTGKIYSRIRRNFDLTIPTPQNPVEGFGGADILLDFIESTVRPTVRAKFPAVQVCREAIYGHSYGGLFALHALFTRPWMFDAFIASSPSIWWHERCILEEAKGFIERVKKEEGKGGGGEKLPTLMMYLGGLEQDPPQWNDEPGEKWEERKRTAAILNMRKNVLGLMGLLGDCPRLHTVRFSEYGGEDHGTVMACSMSRGLTTFLEEWPVPRGSSSVEI
ncbi:Alpha/Beta hydrolase protein [Aspergillus cavernicola]|uniref:Alpha/Beta hydrolase protein n=1 Tax=Aspergillus cavernicola TaxID=176166 RepID=A0ABR4I815_9EURO